MWQVVGASTLGTSHIRADVPCQDAHGYRISSDLVIAAVADGLGSAARSDEGAKLAVETALDALSKALATTRPDNPEDWTRVLQDAFLQARECLQEAAEKSAAPLRDYGTTLIAVAIAEDWLAVGHIGDGAVVAALDDGTVETVSTPQRGEYANEVAPLTAADALELVRFSVRKGSLRALALLTDGLQNLCINAATARPYEPFFAPFFDAIGQEIDTVEVSHQLACFLGTESVCRKTDDDKTLVVVGKILHRDDSADPLSNSEAAQPI
jgi:hypothetical protein